MKKKRGDERNGKRKIRVRETLNERKSKVWGGGQHRVTDRKKHREKKRQRRTN